MDLQTNAPRTKDVFKRFKRGGTQLGDLDKDGDTKEPMKQAAKDAKKRPKPKNPFTRKD